MLYRVHEGLLLSGGKRYPRGTMSPLKGVSGTAKTLLLEKGRISIVRTPPLDVLPGFERKALVFAKAGITDVSQLLSADLGQLSEQLKIPLGKLEACVADVREYLVIF